jgi:hypothetical protein
VRGVVELRSHSRRRNAIVKNSEGLRAAGIRNQPGAFAYGTVAAFRTKFMGTSGICHEILCHSVLSNDIIVETKEGVN